MLQVYERVWKMQGYSLIGMDIANGDDRPVLEHMLQCGMLAGRHRCWVTKYIEFGPAGGNPYVQIVGKDEDLLKFLMDPYTYGATTVSVDTDADGKTVLTGKYAKEMKEEAEMLFSQRQPAVWDDGRFEVQLGVGAVRPVVLSDENIDKHHEKPGPKIVKSQLSVLSYANGFSVWHYMSAKDTVADMFADGYFDEAKDMLREGDTMYLVSSSTGGAKTTLAYVMYNKRDSVVISMMP